MAAHIARLRTRRDRLRADQGEELRRLIADRPGLPDRARGEIIAAIDRETAGANGWTFVMLSPTQNRAVLDWLVERSRRPRHAVKLWALLFEHLRRDTGEVMLTREQMAGAVGTTPTHVSAILREMEGIGAISRQHERVPGMKGRGVVRCYMNPNVGTHLGGVARDRAQAEAPPLRMVEPEPA